MNTLKIALAAAVVTAAAVTAAYADVDPSKEPHSVYLQSLQDEYVPPANTPVAHHARHHSSTSESGWYR